MTEQGIVVASKSNNYIQVRIGRNSACASCGKCGMTEGQKHVDFFVENTKQAQVGDAVSVDIPETNAVPLALVGYILPIIPALALLFCGIALQLPDWASLLMFFGGLAVGFSVVFLLERLRKHRWMQAPVLLEIVRHANISTPVENETIAKSETAAGIIADENSEKEKKDE